MKSEVGEKNILGTIRRKVLLIILLILATLEVLFFIFITTEEIKTIDIDITSALQDSFIQGKSAPFFIKLIHILNDIYAPYVIIAIIYNFYTIYDCFILVNVLSVDYIISYTLKLIYEYPTYNYLDGESKENTYSKIFYCGYGWGFPCEESLISISFYLSVWKIIVSKIDYKYDKSKKIIKYSILFCFIFLCLIYNFGILLNGYYFMSHIIFSNVAGIMIYLILFEANFFNILNGKELIDFIRNKYLLYLNLNLAIFFVLSIFYIIKRVSEGKEDYYKICTSMDGKELFKDNGYYSYIDGTYVYSILFLSDIFSMVGIIIDLIYINNKNHANFYQINFPQELEDFIKNASQGSFNGSIRITQDICWNNTPIFISLLRLIVVLVFTWICFLPFLFINLQDHHVIIIFIVRFFLSTMIFFMGIFCFFKPLLKLMKLTNNTSHSILDDI